MKLYWGSGSPFAWRAMLALIVKGVEFEDQLLSFSEGEHKSAEYLALAPRGQVPALVDGDTVVTESLAIIAYIDRKVPQPPLFGTTPTQAGRIAQRLYEHENYLGKAAQGVMRPIFRNQLPEKAEEIRSHTGALRDELATFDRMLEHDPWLGGEQLSVADIALYPTLCLIERLSSRPGVADLGVPALDEDYARLADFKRRFSELPGVERAHPPHWKA